MSLFEDQTGSNETVYHNKIPTITDRQENPRKKASPKNIPQHKSEEKVHRKGNIGKKRRKREGKRERPRCKRKETALYRTKRVKAEVSAHGKEFKQKDTKE